MNRRVVAAFALLTLILSPHFHCTLSAPAGPSAKDAGVDCATITPVNVSAPDHTVGDGTAASCTEAALRSAVEAGGTIVCECGGSAPTIALSSPLLVSKATVLDGGGITLDGGGSSRLIEKNTAADQAGGISLTIQNIALHNGKAGDNGGAVLNKTFGAFTAINVTFKNNTCTNTGPFVGGGAMYSTLQKKIVLSGCTFTGNEASNGGAVGGVGNTMTIVNCTFTGNRAFGTGGGENGDGGIGGAVYIDGVDQNGVMNELVICGSVFRNNESNDHAGALFSYLRPDKGSSTTINACSFEGNTENVNQAGAIYHQNGTLTLTNSTINNNTSVTRGAGLWVYGATLDMSNCTIKGNSCTGDKGLGGGMAINSTTAMLTNCTFANNQTNHFANAIMNSGTLTLRNTVFYNNNPGTGPNVNVWAGVAINKGSALTDGGGNMQWPTTYLTNWTDAWLEENPGVLREDPQLEPLADNGGPTKTMALPSNSPAVNKGALDVCTATDQRGISRDGKCDIGAFEYVARTARRSDLRADARQGRRRRSRAAGTVERMVDLRGRVRAAPGRNVDLPAPARRYPAPHQ